MCRHSAFLAILLLSVYDLDTGWSCGGQWKEEIDSQYYDHMLIKKCIFDRISHKSTPNDVSADTQHLR